MNLCAANWLKVGSSLLWYKDIHKWTWHTEIQVRLCGVRWPVHGVVWQLLMAMHACSIEGTLPVVCINPTQWLQNISSRWLSSIWG